MEVSIVPPFRTDDSLGMLKYESDDGLAMEQRKPCHHVHSSRYKSPFPFVSTSFPFLHPKAVTDPNNIQDFTTFTTHKFKQPTPIFKMMFTKIAVLMAAALGSAATIDKRASYSGQMTYFYPGLGACGETNNNNDAVAAVSPAVYASGGGCNKMATIHYNGKTTTARVVDLCPSCATGNIDVSPTVFQALSPLDAGRIDVTWELN